MAAGKVLYNLPWFNLWPPVHQPLVFISAVALCLSLAFGPSLVYPRSRSRGAPPAFSAAAALLTPVVWDIWEMVRVSRDFSLGVSLYYGLNPMFLGAIAFAVFQMGLWESVYRLRGNEAKGKTGLVGPILTAATGAAAVYVMLFWAMGAHWFYLYGKGYKLLFH